MTLRGSPGRVSSLADSAHRLFFSEYCFCYGADISTVGDHEEVRDFELAPGWGQGSADGESWPQSVDEAAIFLCR